MIVRKAEDWVQVIMATKRGARFVWHGGIAICLAVIMAGSSIALAQERPSDPYGRAIERVAQQDFAGAIRILEGWTPSQQGDEERRLWALARIALEAEDLPLARRALSRLVSLRPDEARFRAELAKVLTALGEDERAAYQAEFAGTAPTQRTVLAREKTFSTRLSFAIVPQSNPAQRTDAEVIEVLGLPLRLAPGARAQSATGVRASATALWSPRLNATTRGKLSFGVSGQLYEDRALNDVVASAEIGLVHVTSGNLRIDGSLGYYHRWLAGALYSRGPGVTLGFTKAIGTRGRFVAAFATQWLDHPRGAVADGPRSIGQLTYSHGISSQTVVRASTRFERTEAKVDFLSVTAREVGLGMTHAFRGGLIMGTDILFREARYDGATALFPRAREDRRSTLRVRLTHADLSWKGFAPSLELEVVRQKSNLPVNRFRNTAVSLGFTKSF